MSTAIGTAYGAYYGVSSTVANALCLVMDPATPESGASMLSVAIIGAPGESVGLAIDGNAWSPVATLLFALDPALAHTALAVYPTTAPLSSGDLVLTASSTAQQLWVVSANTPVGSNSIPVVSQTPNFEYQAKSAVGSTIVLDVDGDGLYTAPLPNLTTGTHTLAGLGSNSGEYDLAFPIKFAPQSTAPDVTIPIPPETNQQIKWRFFDPQVTTYSAGQLPRTNLALFPRGNFTGLGNMWSFFGTYLGGTYSQLTAQTTPLAGVSTARRKTVTAANIAGFNIQFTGADANAQSATWGNSPYITPNAAYTLSFYARTTRADGLSTGSYFSYAWFDISGAIISNGTAQAQGLVSGSWVRQSVTMTAPKNAAMIGIYFGIAPGDQEPLVGDTIDTTGLLVEQTDTLGDYFDGSSTAADTIYAWVSEPNLSFSLAWPGYYEMLTNPQSWTSPNPVKNISHQATPPVDNGAILAWEGGQKATTFTFTGITRTQWEYKNLQSWAARPYRFWLVDHRNVARLVLFTQFDATPRNSPTTPWESDYTMHVTQYAAPSDGFSYA